MSQERHDKIVELYHSGMTGLRIAKFLRAGKNRVYEILNSHGLVGDRPRHCLSLAQEQEAVQAYQKGETMKSIGERNNCSTCTIRNILIRHNCPSRGKGTYRLIVTDEEMEQIKTDWISGMSQKAIAERYGVCQVVISRRLAKCGIRKGQKTAMGARHGRWKGGKVTHGTGYVWVKLDRDDPFFIMTNSLGYAGEHRVVIARHIGRPLTKEETVHHINGDRGDNRLENLQLRSKAHGKGQCRQYADCGSTNIVCTEI